MAIDNMGMREVWTCGSGDMRAGRQTDRQTRSSQYSAPPPGTEYLGGCEGRCVKAYSRPTLYVVSGNIKPIEPRTSALNMTLPAAAAQAPADIDRYPVRGAGRCRLISAARARAQQQIICTPLLLSIDGTDGRTDTRPLHRPCTV